MAFFNNTLFLLLVAVVLVPDVVSAATGASGMEPCLDTEGRQYSCFGYGLKFLGWSRDVQKIIIDNGSPTVLCARKHSYDDATVNDSIGLAKEWFAVHTEDKGADKDKLINSNHEVQEAGQIIMLTTTTTEPDAEVYEAILDGNCHPLRCCSNDDDDDRNGAERRQRRRRLGKPLPPLN